MKSVGLENIPSARLLFCLIDSLNHRISIIQAQFSSLRQVLDTSLLVSTFDTSQATVVICLSQTRIYPDGNAVIIDGLRQLVSASMHITPIIIDVGIIAAQTDSIAEISLGRMDIRNTLALSTVKLIHLSLTDSTLPVSQRTLFIQRDI